MNRDQSLERARSQIKWDIAIIGGGATGLGIAVDAASRGYNTILVEQCDFAKATSSRSTKLVHGGVRYLEQGDIPLVLEALHERGLLHTNAPHLVHHLSFIVPRYKWWEGPFFGLGLKLYDALAGKLNLAPSRLLNRADTIAHIPNIEQDHLLGGVEYFDGQFDDARLAITLAQTATDHSACLLNYCRVTSLQKINGVVSGFTCTDLESGEELTIKASVVINACGIFADNVRSLDDHNAPPTTQISQGIHLVFDRKFLTGNSAIMVPHTDDGRVPFAIPWHNRVVVGTTDTTMNSPELEPRPLNTEIDFVFRNIKHYLHSPPSQNDILSVFAGQRPLVHPPGKSKKEASKKISRRHEIFISNSGLITIVGGKWTIYRKMAEDTVNTAIQIGHLPTCPCRTHNLPLHGAMTPQEHNFLSPYGTDNKELTHLIAADPSLKNPLHSTFPYPRATVVWAARKEMARTVEDVLSRRTRCLLLDAQASISCAPDVAQLLAAEHNRPETWINSQITEYSALAKGYLHP